MIRSYSQHKEYDSFSRFKTNRVEISISENKNKLCYVNYLKNWDKIWFFFFTQGAFNTEGMALHYCSPILYRYQKYSYEWE